MLWLVYALIAVAFMGSNSFIVKRLVKTVNPSVVMLYQFMLAAPLILSYALFSGALIFNPLLLLLGVGYFCSLTFFYYSLIKGDLTRSGPIFGLSLLVTAILGFTFLNEPINLKVILGLALGLTSVYLLGGKS